MSFVAPPKKEQVLPLVLFPVAVLFSPTFPLHLKHEVLDGLQIWVGVLAVRHSGWHKWDVYFDERFGHGLSLLRRRLSEKGCPQFCHESFDSDDVDAVAGCAAASCTPHLK